MSFDKYIVKVDDSFKYCLKKIQDNQSGFVLVENENFQIVGVITDGDIRRVLIDENHNNLSLLEICNKNFISSDESASFESLYKILDNKIRFIPILDNQKRLLNIFDKKSLPLRDEKNICTRSKSPVRISFGGGGSDTTSYFTNNNGAVLNAAISIYSHCTLIKKDDKKILINSLDLKLEIEYDDINDFNSKKDDFELFRALIYVIKPDFGFELYIQSDFPIGTGLGGSATVLSAIIGCFNELRIDKWNMYEISEIAYEAERIHLNISGGWQDQYATVFGGINFMEFQSNDNLILPIKLNKDLLFEFQENLVLCFTNSNHGDNDIHEDQKKNTLNKDIIENIKINVDLVYEMKKTLLKGNLNGFGDLLNKAWNLKKSFSPFISNSYLDDIYNEALKNGSFGGKLLGAGGGGYFLFYTNYENRNNLINWMNSKENLTYTPFEFTENGLYSWTLRN